MDWTRRAVTALLASRGLRLKRSLGQNYLVDRNFLEALAKDSGAGPGDHVVEIGSGLGNLTERLAARGARVTAFELDPAIHGLSRELLGEAPGVTLLNEDGAGFAARVGPGPLRLVSNLPYGVWQDLVLAVLEAPQAFLSIVLMIQTDVYERLKASPGTRAYGPMSALVQAAGGVRKIRTAGKALFLPVPRVESTVFELRRPEPLPDARALARRLAGLFAGRRKRSAAAGGRRIESLSPGELLSLARLS
jgi:16S rRNA (adenine1518-N6/adenine1519-N6)-dimethyltransferase